MQESKLKAEERHIKEKLNVERKKLENENEKRKVKLRMWEMED